MAQRNYACDNIIDVYFGKMDLTEVGEQAFKKQLYLCMLGQALLIKSNIETRRSLNELGIIVWQYNEIWCVYGVARKEKKSAMTTSLGNELKTRPVVCVGRQVAGGASSMALLSKAKLLVGVGSLCSTFTSKAFIPT